jgi:hypothetical protein
MYTHRYVYASGSSHESVSEWERLPVCGHRTTNQISRYLKGTEQTNKKNIPEMKFVSLFPCVLQPSGSCANCEISPEILYEASKLKELSTELKKLYVTEHYAECFAGSAAHARHALRWCILGRRRYSALDSWFMHLRSSCVYTICM